MLLSYQSTITSHPLNATQMSLVDRFISKWPKLVTIFDYIAYYTFIDPDLYWKELSEIQSSITFILWFEIHNDTIVFLQYTCKNQYNNTRKGLISFFFIGVLWYDAKFIRIGK